MKTTITIYLISILIFSLSFEMKSNVLGISLFIASLILLFIGFIKMGIDAWINFLSLPVNHLSRPMINGLWNLDKEMKIDLIEINWEIEHKKKIQKSLNNHPLDGNYPLYPNLNIDASVF